VAFTRQHYKAIADILQSILADYDTCCKFADYFATDNERFDRDRFLEACGYA